MADAEISGGDVERFELILDDSILVDAGIEDFRQALRREVPECSSLQPILTAGFRDATADTDPAMFVAKVLLARRKLTIEIASRGSGGVEAESLLKRIGRWVFGATASVTAQTDRSTTIEVVSNAVLPVAYQPYYIPVRRTVGTTMGGGGTQSQTVVRLEAFRPELPSHAAAWEQWISELQ